MAVIVSFVLDGATSSYRYSGPAPRHYICDTEGELPTSGLSACLDTAYTKDSHKRWTASSATAWIEDAGGGSGVTDHGALTGLSDDDHPQYTTAAEADAAASAAVATHEAAADPHAGYQRESEKNQAGGYPGLDGSSKIAGAQQTYGSSANTACQGNDSRLSDARTPTAHALGGAEHSVDTLANLNSKISDADVPALAGQLGGTPASPDVRGLRETGGPTNLTLGAITDGQFLKRSGSTIVGDSPSGSIPAGLICMWHGLLANIPSGWVLCDGTNGTPDLRSKFVKGAAAGVDPGATGGALTHTHADHASHTHTYSQVVNHTHPVTDPGHTHLTQRYPTATGGSSGFTIDTSMSGTLADNTLPTKSATTGITTSDPAGGVAQGTTDGPSAALAHDAVNHEPPYYAVAYIMKT